MAKKAKKLQESALIEKYTYKIHYSSEDECFIGRCAEFPSLSAIGKNQAKALNEIMSVVQESVNWMIEDGEVLPTPLSDQKFSGKILVRVSPEKHRELSEEAQFNNISMNQFIANKL